MKLIYATDIHGDFEKVRNLLFETVADVYIIAGDLIDIPFYNMGASIRYHEIQSYFNGLRRKMGLETITIEDFVDELLENPDISEEIEDLGTRYQQLTIRARRVMQQKYKVLKDIFLSKPSSSIYCIPGNYDMDLKFTSLHDNDLHLHWFIEEGLKISGYGGADVWTTGIPERYVVRYQAGRGADERGNEMFRFFRAVKPDIIAVHQPAWGIHDRASYAGPVGSPSLRTYCDSNPVTLCLSGHAHHAWGVLESGGTLYLNPSNFGAVTQVNGEVSEGGFFHQVEIEEGKVRRVVFRKIADEKVYDVADYYPKGGEWTAEVIDRERWLALAEQRNFDTTVVKYSHIPEIELFNEIKKFFRSFQTRETEYRIDVLEEVARLLDDKIKGHIAMDVMGSVNMGTDAGLGHRLVLYLRCDRPCFEAWAVPLLARARGDPEARCRRSTSSRYSTASTSTSWRRASARELHECEVTSASWPTGPCRPSTTGSSRPSRTCSTRTDLPQGAGRQRAVVPEDLLVLVPAHDVAEVRVEVNAVGIKLPESIRIKIRQHLNGQSE